jgi:hypothetical protein
MNTTQSLILERIAAEVTERGDNVVLVDDRAWANRGTLRTFDAATLDHIAAVSYDFQADNCHFGPIKSPAHPGGFGWVAAVWYGRPAEGMAPWVKGSIAELVEAVTSYLLAEWGP